MTDCTMTGHGHRWHAVRGSLVCARCGRVLGAPDHGGRDLSVFCCLSREQRRRVVERARVLLMAADDPDHWAIWWPEICAALGACGYDARGLIRMATAGVQG